VYLLYIVDTYIHTYIAYLRISSNEPLTFSARAAAEMKKSLSVMEVAPTAMAPSPTPGKIYLRKDKIAKRNLRWACHIHTYIHVSLNTIYSRVISLSRQNGATVWRERGEHMRATAVRIIRFGCTCQGDRVEGAATEQNAFP
jgi:hypothetical protein